MFGSGVLNNEGTDIICMDVLAINVSGQQTINIPLKAIPANPYLDFEHSLDFGIVMQAESGLESRSLENLNENWIVRKLKVKNIGPRDTLFSCSFDESEPLLVSPKSFHLGSHNSKKHPKECELTVAFSPQSLGKFESKINVIIQAETDFICKTNAPELIHSEITIKANVIDHQLAIYTGSNSELCPLFKNQIEFGSVYFGQTIRVPITLKNQSEKDLKWAITLEKMTIPTSRNGLEISQRERRKAIEAQEENRTNITVFPMNGSLSAQDSTEITFTFNPTVFKSFYGFKANNKQLELKKYQMNMRLQVIDENTSIENVIVWPEKSIDLSISGQACPLLASLSCDTIKYDSSQRGKKFFEVINNSKNLGFRYDIQKIAHFSFEPNHGTLMPEERVAIVVTFEPNQMGFFECSVFCEIKHLPNAVTGAFFKEIVLSRLPLKLIGSLVPRDAIQSRPKTADTAKSQIDTCEGKLPFIFSKRPKTIPTPYNKLMEKEWKEKIEHRDIYINFIRRNLKSGNIEQELATGRKLLCFDHENGLEAPQPIVNIKTANFKNKTSNTIKSLSNEKSALITPLDMHDAILTPIDLDHIYASSNVIDFGNIPPHSRNTIIFTFENQIPSKSTVNLKITVNKDGRDSISITPNILNLHYQGTAAVEVTCIKHEAGFFESSLTYVINNRYIYNINIRANVTYKLVTVSSNNLNFEISKFMEASTEFKTKRSQDLISANTINLTKITIDNVEYQFPVYEKKLELKNKDGEEVFYKIVDQKKNNKQAQRFSFLEYGHNDGIFEVAPPEGIIPANKSLMLNVSYTPGTRSSVEHTLEIIIFDTFGNKRKQIQVLQLKCKAEGPFSQCSILNYSSKIALDLGLLPVLCSGDASTLSNIAENSVTELSKSYSGRTPVLGRKIIKVKNSGPTVCHYVACYGGKTNFARLEKTFGIIPSNGSADIIVYALPESEGFFEEIIIINILGGSRSFKVPIRYQAAIPNVSIHPTGPCFEKEVILGSFSSQAYMVKNSGTVYGRLVLDLNRYNDLSIKPVGLDEEENIDAKLISTFSLNKSTKTMEGERYGMIENRGAKLYVIDSLPGDEFSFAVIFQPKMAKDYFEKIPVKLLGSIDYKYIEMNTRGISSPLTLSRTEIVFRDVLFSSFSNGSQPENKEIFSITNSAENEIDWFLEDHSNIRNDSIFLIEPKTGLLQIGETQLITITFSPDFASNYVMNAILKTVYHDKQVEFNVNIKGKCVKPSISFEPPEIFLPIVPLGVVSTYSFFIVNHGYEIREINAVISQDLKRDGITLELNFPDGVN